MVVLGNVADKPAQLSFGHTIIYSPAGLDINCCQHWLVSRASRHLLMTSQILVAYVIEPCLFLTLLSRAAVSGRRCKWVRVGYFTEECTHYSFIL